MKPIEIFGGDVCETNKVGGICLCLAVLRVFLEVIGFEFKKLPLTKRVLNSNNKFHQYGLYFSVGYIILFAPQFLFWDIIINFVIHLISTFNIKVFDYFIIITQSVLLADLPVKLSPQTIDVITKNNDTYELK